MNVNWWLLLGVSPKKDGVVLGLQQWDQTEWLRKRRKHC